MRILLASAVVAWVLFAPGSLWARLNLPQTELHIQLSSTTAAAIGYFLRNGPGGEAPAASLEQLLLKSLPEEFASSCRGMVEHWGTEARGTEAWSVRTLAPVAGRIWLAFRCGSRLSVYADSYDERLAMLDPQEGILVFVPLGPNLEDDSTLYRLRFDDTLKIAGGEAVAFRVKSTTDNPCCDGGDRQSEEHMVALEVKSGAPAEVLNVVIGRDSYSHDDEDGDSERVYSAKVHFQRDAAGYVTSVTADYREETKSYDLDGKLRKTQPAPRIGQETFRWNPKAIRFLKNSEDK